ncbi:MAG: hypothetical protein F2837_12425, partial [Actinobacteria bacterium]|nr:hypothetical protein [Actinomycetota bacterium]
MNARSARKCASSSKFRGISGIFGAPDLRDCSLPTQTGTPLTWVISRITHARGCALHGNTAALSPMTIQGVGTPASLAPIRVLVIDRSRAAECKILVHLENAGHQIIHARDENAVIELLLGSVDETPEDQSLIYSGVSVEPEHRTVHVHGTPVELSRLEFEFLLALIETPMRVLTHGELAERVWGNYDVGLKAISVLASR